MLLHASREPALIPKKLNIDGLLILGLGLGLTMGP